MNSQTRKLLLQLFSVGLIFRIIFLLYFGPIHAGDTNSYLGIVEKIIQGEFYPNIEDAFRPPGYPLFISLWMIVSGGDLWILVIFQQILSALLSIIIYFLALIIYDEKIARLSAWLIALNPALAYFSTAILSESLSIFLFSSCLLIILLGIKNQKLILFFVSGLTLSYLLLITPIGIILAFSVFVSRLIYPNLNRKPIALLLFIVPVVFIYIFWSGHNYMKYNSIQYSPLLGLNLLERTSYLPDPNNELSIMQKINLNYDKLIKNNSIGNQKKEAYWAQAVIYTIRELRNSSEDIFQLNKVFFKTSLSLIRKNPLTYLKATIGEFGYIWAGYTPHWAKWRPADPGYLSDWSFFILGPIIGFIMFFLVSLAILDNFYNTHFFSYFLIIPIILITVVYSMISFTGYRYRLIVEPQILILISYSILQYKSGLWPFTIFKTTETQK